MKLFTKIIDKKLFAQYPKGGDLEGQKVIAKIFNPYGRGRWYLMNSDPDEPDYLWGIVELYEGEPEVGSVSRKELENIKVGAFKLPLERDLYFDETDAIKVYNGLKKGDRFAKGGELDVVLNEGNGKIINKLYNDWNNIKTEKEYKKWVEQVKSTKFGTYGTISFDEVLKNFDFDNAPINSTSKKDFKSELNNALNKEYKYADGGGVDSIEVGDEVYARWNDSMQWTLGTFKGETKNGFEVYDFKIEKPDHIEFYAQISKLPYPYGRKKTFYSEKFKDRNYKNYHFNKYADGGTLPTLFGQAGLVGETGTLNEMDLFAMGGDLPQGVHQFYGQTYNPAYPTPYGYAKGGKLKYDPARDIVAIAIKDGQFNKLFFKGDFLGGAYQMESGGVLKDYNYVSPRNIIFARLKSGEDIKPVNGFYIRKNASGTVMTNAASKPITKANLKPSKINIPRPILLTSSPSKSPKMMKFIGTFSSKDSMRPAMTFVQVKEGNIVATDAFKLIRIIDGSTLNENKLVCESAKCKNESDDQNFPNVSSVINAIDNEFSESYDIVELYKSLMQVRNDDLKNKVAKGLRQIELKLKNQTIGFEMSLLLQCVKGCLLLGWKKAFISYSDVKKNIVFTEEKAEGRVGEVSLIILMPRDSYDTTDNITITPNILFEQGGLMF